MKAAKQTLMHQMHISMQDVERRKQLLGLTNQELDELAAIGGLVAPRLDSMVEDFYDNQTSIPEISTLIGDLDTLKRLQRAQHQYLLDLFSGSYDSNYVNNRLRIGMVHKRIGVEPKLYLSAVQTLKTMLMSLLKRLLPDARHYEAIAATLEKLFMFDTTLVVETYVWSLVNEIKSSKEKIEQYAHALEYRAQEMEELSQRDPLTGLLNVRHFSSILNSVLYAAQRALEPVTVVFIDINDFKTINDQQGHPYGDKVLQVVAEAIKKVARIDDHCFRYGGDEFCLVLPHCTEIQVQESVVPRLLECLLEEGLNITLSIGVQQTDHINGYLDAMTLVNGADAQMYSCKKRIKESADQTK
ncbi:MAG: GGDEF domain-containing protein [Acinetobacter sp.]